MVMRKSEEQLYYTELYKELRDKLGIPDEDAGVFTESQTKLLRILAEGYPLWEVKARNHRGEWKYHFDFKHKKTVWLTADEIAGLKSHIDFFTSVGLCGLTPDLQRTVELDVIYEQESEKGP
jgi:hypothetical protein